MVHADTVIFAVGQFPETGFMQEMGVELSGKGGIEICPETGATNVEGVFAGGDGAGGRAFVADAIASGKMGALAILCFLEGKDVRDEFQKHRIGAGPSFSFQRVMEPGSDGADLRKVVSFDGINTLCFPHAERNRSPEFMAMEERVRTFGEVTSGLAPKPMAEEISRCFKCGMCTRCDLCFLLCPDVSIQKVGRGYDVRTEYCKGCSVCASTCPRHVIEMGSGR